MTVNSHMSLWLTVAKHFNVHPQSLSTFIKQSSEGLPYFYQKLPALGKELEFGLDRGFFDITAVPFCKKKDTVLPLFLYELFKNIFDDEGYIRPNPINIGELRQLLLLFYKFEEEPSSTQVDEANDKFIQRDSIVGFNNISGNYPLSIDQVRKNFMSLLPDDPKDIKLQHSSGATADQVTNNNKIHTFHNTPAMAYFGIDCIFLDEVHANATLQTGSLLGDLPPARVVQVPKDARGPRSICCEPHTNMKYQLGLMLKIYDFVENASPAKGYVNFTNQNTNRILAHEGSINRKYTTIDLKDASDMVSWDLIQRLVPEDWLVALTVTRSSNALVGDTHLSFKKFAPMGSALCFPVEAILFWAIARTISPEVWVYGDDIIVERVYAQQVIEALESYSLIVNRSKTLHDGFFRESCGGDFYRGEPIDYIKCKSYSLDRFIAFANLIGDAHGRNLSDELIAWYEKHNQVVIYRRPLSERSRPESLVYYSENCSASEVFFKRRWNKDLQLTEVRRLFETTKSSSKNSSFLSEMEEYHANDTSQISAKSLGALIRQRSLDDSNGLMHWLQNASSVDPLMSHANRSNDILLDEYIPRSVSFAPDYRLSGRSKPKSTINFGWGVHNPVRGLTA